MFSATYGIEIECYLPDGPGTSRQAAATAISARLVAAGLTGDAGSCQAEMGLTHAVRPCWKIVTDGSLGSYDRGMEVVSPILSGPEGLDAVKAVMEALTDFGCTVSKNCGLHVHVGVGDPGIDFFKTLTKLYAANEPIIDRFMPQSRRASANQYCRTITDITTQRIDQAATYTGLCNLFVAGRYHKLNLTAHNRYQTVEFRQHSGTLDHAKAANWVKFCLRMVKAAREGRIGPVTTTVSHDVQVNRGRYGSAARTIGDLMLRPQGVTKTEACAAVGWQSCSMPQQARSCGLSFTTRREGREIRYYATSTSTISSTPVTATLDSLLATLGCEADEAQYFRARTASLSGPVAWAA